MKFAVSIISPPDYPHARSVWEVAETLHYGLVQLGHDSVITFDTSTSDRQHITLLPNMLVAYDGKLAPNTVLYNLDQIYPGSPWLQPVVLDHFLQYPLWDYSQANIDQLYQMGIAPVQPVPIGYVPELTRIPALDEDIDVLFYGSVNQRRHQILESLRSEGVNVAEIFGLYGPERDAYIARSKIVLNMHFYPAKVFEIVRVSYLLANRRFVISERGCDPVEESAFAPGIVFSDYDHLVETCLDFLDRPQDRTHIAEVGFDLMAQRPETTYLEPALQAISARSERADSFVFQPDLYRKRQAALCLEQGDYETAIALYEASLEVDSTCSLSYWNLGLALLLSGDEMAAQFCWGIGSAQTASGCTEASNAELFQVLHQANLKQRESQRIDLAERIERQILEMFPDAL
jgi:tetratricopeptide (TPR) repeat protein